MEKVIGIEVKGEVYRIEDEETSGKTQTLETKVATAEINIESLETAATEQAEKVAKIETNIGETDISELSETVEGHSDELTEIFEELPKIKTDIDDIKFNGVVTPLFTLDRIESKGIASIPTISAPASVTGTGVLRPTADRLAGFRFSLQFFNNCIAVTQIDVLRSGSVPAEWNSFGDVEFGILYSYIKTLLKSKYPERAEEIDNYVDKILPTFTTGQYYVDNQSIVFQGEPGAECISTQQITLGGSGQTYFSFRYTCDRVIKVLSAGTYYDSSITYNTFAVLRRKAA